MQLDEHILATGNLMNDTNQPLLFLIDDDPEMLSLLSDFFSGKGLRTRIFSRASLALGILRNVHADAGSLRTELPDLVISDIRMPEISGLEFVKRSRALFPSIPVILATAFGSIETALAAVREGAYDYVVKPFKLAELEVAVFRALEASRLRGDVERLKRDASREWEYARMMGKSPAMRALFDLVERVAQSQASVLVTGESGTGKEMVARALHDQGARAKGPFVAVNCSAIPDTLLESELFGHAKGAFTGATHAKRGLFLEANHGTLFLDEIGDMPLMLQAKLLRVLQERKVRAVGENVSLDLDVRVVAATHRDLRAAISQGNFRDDLFYRLSVIPIALPALRHRQGDIILLARRFLERHAAQGHGSATDFTPEAVAQLLQYPWPGNVRELENTIERAVVLTRGPLIDVAYLPSAPAMHKDAGVDTIIEWALQSLPTLAELEDRYVHFILEKTGGRKEKAARILGINRRTLHRRGIGEGRQGSARDAFDALSVPLTDEDDPGCR